MSRTLITFEIYDDRGPIWTVDSYTAAWNDEIVATALWEMDRPSRFGHKAPADGSTPLELRQRVMGKRCNVRVAGGA